MEQQSKFERFLEKLAGRITNIVLLGFFATLFSLPIVTAGASMTAVHEAMSSYLQYDDKKPLKTFFAGFKSHFKVSTIVWLIHVVIIVVLVWDYVYYTTADSTFDILARTAIFTIGCVLLFELNIVFVVLSADLANTVKDAFKMALDVAFTCFLESIELLLLDVAVIIVSIFLLRVLLLVMPGVIAYLQWLIIPKMLKKYKYKSGNRDYQREQRNNGN